MTFDPSRITSVVLDYKSESLFIINWSIKECGFGQFTFKLADGFIHCDNECMKKSTVLSVLKYFFDNLVIVEEGDETVSFSSLELIEVTENDKYVCKVLNKTNKKELDKVFNYIKCNMLTWEEKKEIVDKILFNMHEKVRQNKSIETIESLDKDIKELLKYRHIKIPTEIVNTMDIYFFIKDELS